MPQLVPVTRDRHALMRWRRYESFSFAADQAVFPLVGGEVPRAALAFPVGFMQDGAQLIPVAVLGLEASRNLMVLDDGGWRAAYVPAVLRAYPFALATTPDGQQVLCVDEDSGLVTPEPRGERFFNDDGSPSQAVRQVMEFLQGLARSRAVAGEACASLQSAGVIEPWTIVIRTDRGEKRVEGLSRVNEQALNALADDAFLTLRKTAALAIAYAQLLSTRHLHALAALAERESATLETPQFKFGEDLDLSAFESGTLKFGPDKTH